MLKFYLGLIFIGPRVMGICLFLYRDGRATSTAYVADEQLSSVQW